MSFEEMSKAELIDQLEALSGKEAREERERLLYELRVHQMELELQNRELREAQATIEQSRNRYADLYDFAPVAYFTFDASGCIEEVNLTGATMLGRERAKLVGLPFLAVVAMDEPDRFWTHLRRCAATPVTSELAFRVAPRGPVEVQAISTPVQDSSGRAVAFRTAFTDIGERKQGEVKLQEALAREKLVRRQLEAIDRANATVAEALASLSSSTVNSTQSSTPNTVLRAIVDQARSLANAEFAAFGAATAAGQAFERWVASGMEPAQAAALDRVPRAVGVLGHAIAEGRTLRLRDLREHPSFVGFPPHHPQMTSFLGVPVRREGGVIGNLFLANKLGSEEFTPDDQSSVEMLAARIAAVIEAARLNDATKAAVDSRDNLLAIVSHDLKSPLSAISLSCGVLTRVSPDGERRAGHKQLEVIKRSADRMTRLIEDLLTATTIETGRFVVIFKPTSVTELIAETVQLFEPLTHANSLRLEHSLPAQLPKVLCDRERILQVLSNLVGNALKFTPAQGCVTLSVQARETDLCFTVSDTGPGISPQKLPHVFDRYWKGEASGRHGVGLGLFIAKGIVEAHRGQIWVESGAGQGTSVSFTLAKESVSPPK